MKCLITTSVLFLYYTGIAQVNIGNITSPASQYIEGARVVIDIIQLFKKNPVGKPRPKGYYKSELCNFCIHNSDSIQKIKVTLVYKEIQYSEPSVLVIQPAKKECSLQMKCGIYNCKVETLDEKVISWGDLFINEKEIIVTK